MISYLTQYVHGAGNRYRNKYDGGLTCSDTPTNNTLVQRSDGPDYERTWFQSRQIEQFCVRRNLANA